MYSLSGSAQKCSQCGWNKWHYLPFVRTGLSSSAVPKDLQWKGVDTGSVANVSLMVSLTVIWWTEMTADQCFQSKLLSSHYRQKPCDYSDHINIVHPFIDSCISCAMCAAIPRKLNMQIHVSYIMFELGTAWRAKLKSSSTSLWVINQHAANMQCDDKTIEAL